MATNLVNKSEGIFRLNFSGLIPSNLFKKLNKFDRRKKNRYFFNLINSHSRHLNLSKHFFAKYPAKYVFKQYS